MTLAKSIWDALGSIKLAIYLLAIVAVLFLSGAICHRIAPDVFIPLNSSMLLEWISTFGLENPAYTWWFFLLIGAFFFLGINTFICTLDRTLAIIKLRKRRSSRSILYLLSPHIMHIAFLVIVLGYLALYTLGVNSYNNILKTGFPRTLPGTSIAMELRDYSLPTVPHGHNNHLDGLYVAPSYTLVLKDGDKVTVKKVALNRPCLYKGYSIHVADFRPTRASSSRQNVWVNLTIRKNVGIPIFIAGVLLFVIGVGLYVLSALTDGQPLAPMKEMK